MSASPSGSLEAPASNITASVVSGAAGENTKAAVGAWFVGGGPTVTVTCRVAVSSPPRPSRTVSDTVTTVSLDTVKVCVSVAAVPTTCPSYRHSYVSTSPASGSLDALPSNVIGVPEATVAGDAIRAVGAWFVGGGPTVAVTCRVAVSSPPRPSRTVSDTVTTVSLDTVKVCVSVAAVPTTCPSYRHSYVSTSPASGSLDALPSNVIGVPEATVAGDAIRAVGAWFVGAFGSRTSSALGATAVITGVSTLRVRGPRAAVAATVTLTTSEVPLSTVTRFTVTPLPNVTRFAVASKEALPFSEMRRSPVVPAAIDAGVSANETISTLAPLMISPVTVLFTVMAAAPTGSPCGTRTVSRRSTPVASGALTAVTVPATGAPAPAGVKVTTLSAAAAANPLPVTRIVTSTEAAAGTTEVIRAASAEPAGAPHASIVSNTRESKRAMRAGMAVRKRDNGGRQATGALRVRPAPRASRGTPRWGSVVGGMENVTAGEAKTG